MLMLTHTWVLRECLARNRFREKGLDLYIYNIIPDILPFHESITAQFTHDLKRTMEPPEEFGKFRFILLHLLLDDFAHYGEAHGRRFGFDPDSKGYAYAAGKSMHGQMQDIFRRAGEDISIPEAAYRSHMLIEMAFDLALYDIDPTLLDLMVKSMEFTYRQRWSPHRHYIRRHWPFDQSRLVERRPPQRALKDQVSRREPVEPCRTPCNWSWAFRLPRRRFRSPCSTR